MAQKYLNGVTRRQALGMLAAAPMVTASPPPPNWLAALATRAAALGGPGLMQSYDVSGASAGSIGPFDQAHGNCAYVYDNAAAGLALLAGGHTDLATRIGDALVMAQTNDRFWKDGRFRNAYRSGPAPASGAYPLPGWWDAGAGRWTEDAYQAGTATGVVGWAMLLLLALHRATDDARYRDAAARAGDWVVRATQVTRGFSGGFIGFEPGPTRLGWVSTEHNLDLAVAFAWLGRTDEAAHARDFVVSMWNGHEGRFMTGLRPDGAVNTTAAVDANIWPLLAPGGDPVWAPALGWVLAHQGVPPREPFGVDFNDDRDGIWLEGTAYVALAAARTRDTAVASRMMVTLRAETSPDGLVWASSVPRLTTGLSTGLTDEADFFYYRRGHVGATAWAALAGLRRSPFEK
jgi:hypothetical protein